MRSRKTVPQNAESVLRIDPSGVPHGGPVVHDTSGLPSQEPERRVLVTTHGHYPNSSYGEHKWHGAAASGDGTIVSVPNNADTVLCVGPARRPAYPPPAAGFEVPEPELYELEGRSPGDVATGRHRDDRKYKCECPRTCVVYLAHCSDSFSVMKRIIETMQT